MQKNIILLFILCFLQQVESIAQSNNDQLLFKHYSRASGLPSDYINSMYQDKKGYIWIATDKGVCRYNGIKYEYFNTDNGLPDNMAYNFFEDKQNNIYITCYGNKVAMFNGETLQNYSQMYPNELRNIIGVQFDTQNNAYFFTNKGEILQKNEKNEWFRMQFQDTFPNIIYFNSLVHTISANSTLIFSKSMYLLTYLNEKVHIKELFLSKKTAEEFKTELWKVEIIPNNIQNQWKVKINQQLYIATIKNDSIYHTIIPDKENKNKELRQNILDNFKKENYSSKKLEDYENNLWVYTFGKGIFKYKSNHLKHYSDIIDDIDFVAVENNENIHFAGKKGYYAITPNEVFNSNNATNHQIRDARSIIKNNKNQYFVGTFRKLYTFNNVNDFYNAKIKDSLVSSGGISGIVEQNDTLLIATFGDGLLKYANNQFLKYKNKENGLASDMIEQIITTKNAHWLPTLSNGVSRLDRNTGQMTNFNKENKLLSNMVFAVYENDATTWIGTQNGITKYDKNKQITYYTSQNGLEGTRIYCIFQYENKIFALSDKYLHTFIDNKFQVLRSFDIFDEENIFMNKAFYHSETNLLYLCTNKGLISLNIENAVPKNIIPQLEIEYIKQNKEYFYFNYFNKNKKKITFDYDKNTLEIHFSNLSFVSEDKNQFFYKIKQDNAYSNNNEWINNKNNIIYLQNLPYGSYEVEVKLLNPDGVFSKIEVVKFDIETPFWLTWWFLLLIFALFGVLVALIVRYLSYRKLKTHLKELEIQQKIQNEREYISRELHDNVGAQITFIISNLDYLFFTTKNGKIDELSNQARQTMTMLRETIWATNKTFFEFEELQEKLVEYIQKANIKHKNLSFELNIQPIKHQFHSAQVIQLFRIAQEAIQNVIKHSNASKMNVNIFKNEQKNIVLQVIDNGCGLAEEQKGHFGLQNMNKRATELGGMLLITSKENKGTTVELTF